MSYENQWLFPLDSLHRTPSSRPLSKQLYDRARGIEFLFRLGSSLGLPTPAMLTAATWFHRFYMRYAMEDFHRQDVATACIFLATKTEECGRKLRDVARIHYAKTMGIDAKELPNDSKEVDHCQAVILSTEEYLLDALCFDFTVGSPHADLVDLFTACKPDETTQEYAWSIAHDSYRTPLCILFPPKIIAVACYVLAQRVIDGPNSPSLDARISSAAPSASLPTPPSHKPPSPDASRLAVEFYSFSEAQLHQVAETLGILLEFYSVQDVRGMHPYISSILSINPPLSTSSRLRVYAPFSEVVPAPNNLETQSPLDDLTGRTPNSSHGGYTPAKPLENGRVATEPQKLNPN